MLFAILYTVWLVFALYTTQKDIEKQQGTGKYFGG